MIIGGEKWGWASFEEKKKVK